MEKIVSQEYIESMIKEAYPLMHKAIPLPHYAMWSLLEWKTAYEDNPESYEQLGNSGVGFDVFLVSKEPSELGSASLWPAGILPEQYLSVLFTLSNGYPLEDGMSQPFAHKNIFRKKGRGSPLHHHHSKVEDALNHGPGNLYVLLYNNIQQDGRCIVDNISEVQVNIDNVTHSYPPGILVKVAPGQRIHLPTSLYHAYLAGPPYVVVEEVSGVNDDHNDNCFVDKDLKRFIEIKQTSKAPDVLLYSQMPGTGNFDQLLEKHYS